MHCNATVKQCSQQFVRQCHMVPAAGHFYLMVVHLLLMELN